MSTNARARGKIRHEEWPKIAERFQHGETLAENARSYGCTPPAIRYIVGRVLGGVTGSAGRAPPAGLTAQDAERSRGTAAPSPARGTTPSSAAGNDIWSRINNDIATFLAAMDALFTQESDLNYESLLAATDRLLWASARTRLELERVLAGRRTHGARRRAVA